ncbi:hypothetical protein ACQREA_14460 [Dietzia cinnamea]
MQFLNSIPGFLGSVQNFSRDQFARLEANGMADQPWVADGIRTLTDAGWL